MNKYLTPQKVLIDCISLCRRHFFNISVLIAVIMVPYGYLGTREYLPDSVKALMPIFLLLLPLVDIVCKRMASTSYLYYEFIISNEIKKSFRKLLPYIFILLLGWMITAIGSILIIPGILSALFFELVRVHFVVNDKSVKDSILDVVKLLKSGMLFKALQVYMIPVTIQVIFSVLLHSMVNLETLEVADIEKAIPYIIAGIIIVFPISVCFSNSFYFNLVKENQLDSADQLV